ncbi:serine-rich adhesin for platelets-like [Bacillus rossius redtenbacheri]|uniref:serine-rich adhesin for platelets-like n=1 Tax=Bacillus rossius redtenbacheri TaxID=93214 RepID=UPI002FDE5118
MRPDYLLLLTCVASSRLATCSSVADPLVTQFRGFLGNVLGEVNSAGWSLSYNLSNYETDLIQDGDGWISLRDGQLHDLGSWSRSRDAAVTCDPGHAAVVGVVTFDPLPFSYRYFIEKNNSLSPSRCLTGNLTGLSARLEVLVDLKNTSRRWTDFKLSPTASVNSVVVSDDQLVVQEVTSALERAMNEAMPRLQLRIQNSLDDTLSQGSLDMSSVHCAVSNVVTTSKLPVTTEATKSTNSVTTEDSRTSKPNRESPNKYDLTNGVNSGGERQNSFDTRGASPADQTKHLNKLIDDLLKNGAEKLSSENLLPYAMPDSEQELYQETDGAAFITGKVYGTSSLSLKTEPAVLRLNNSVLVTADVKLDSTVIKFDFNVDSALPANIHGKVDNLMGEMIIVADVTNSSAATSRLARFRMMPTLSFVSASLSGDNVTFELQSEIPDAVRRVFKKIIFPYVEDTVTTLLNKSLDGKILNVSEALAFTTASPTTPTTTTTTTITTTSTSTVATTHSTTAKPTTTTATSVWTPAVTNQSAAPTSIASNTTSSAVSPTAAHTASRSSPAAVPNATSPASPADVPSPSPSSLPGDDSSPPASAAPLNSSHAWMATLSMYIMFILSTQTIL